MPGSADTAAHGTRTGTAPGAWCVYIIECSDGSLYTGITTDLARRWAEHAAGRGARCLRGRPPRRLRYVEAAPDRAAASRREAAIKRLARGAKLALIETARRA